MAPPPKVSLEHQGKHVQVSYSLEAFSFKDFDYYVRRKFTLMDSTIIRYCTAEGEWEDDVLPTAALLKGVSKIRVVCDGDMTNDNSSSYSKYTPVNLAHRISTQTPSSATASHTSSLRSNKKASTMTNSHSRMGTLAGNDDGDGDGDGDNNGNDNGDDGDGYEDDVSCPSTSDKRAEPFTPKATNCKPTAKSTAPLKITAKAVEAAVETASKGKRSSLIYGISSSVNMLDYTAFLPYIITISMAVLLTPKWANGNALYQVFDYMDALAISCGLPSGGISHTEWRTLFMEVYVTFAVRCFTELFIRRALNPENDMKKVLQKFSVDSVFAGLAAGAFVVIRKLAVHNLK